jgi:hypothetical protein
MPRPVGASASAVQKSEAFCEATPIILGIAEPIINIAKKINSRVSKYLINHSGKFSI